MPLHIRVEGLENLHKTLDMLPEQVRRENRRIIHQAVLLVRDEARARIYSRSGRAKRGIGYQEFPSTYVSEAKIFPRSQAAVFSQRSRRPNRKMPPPRKIFRWLQRTGAQPTRATAFLIARAIQKRGTHGKPVMAATLEAKRHEVIAVFAEALQRVIRYRG